MLPNTQLLYEQRNNATKFIASNNEQQLPLN